MANFSQIKRWEILISLIRNHSFPTKKELVYRMERDYGIPITPRTLERDLHLLKTEMGVEISYCHQERGYFIEDESHDQLFEFLQFAGRIFLGELFRESLKDFKGLKRRVKPEDYSRYEGVEYMQPILLAVRNHLSIRFVHENFVRNTKTPYSITPLQLREYDRRWYVVGVPENEERIKTFGLSRISNLSTTGVSSIRRTDFTKQLKKFDKVVGLNYDAADKVELIRIAVSAKQYKYLKTLPLHPSQCLEKSFPDGSVELSMALIPNYELKMQLLKLGDQLEVLEPAFLREEIKNTLERSLGFYQK